MHKNSSKTPKPTLQHSFHSQNMREFVIEHAINNLMLINHLNT